MSQRDQHKTMARRFRNALSERGIALSHGDCLDLVARVSGVKNWNVLSASLDRKEELATADRCDHCGLDGAEGGRIFEGPFSGAICLRCAETFVEAAEHTDLLQGLDAPGGAAAFLADKNVTELERYARIAIDRAVDKERAIEQMTARLAGQSPESMGLRPGVDATRWAWLAMRTRVEVMALREHQIAELQRNRAVQTMLADQLRKREAV